jgi:hypothetical protein
MPGINEAKMQTIDCEDIRMILKCIFSLCGIGFPINGNMENNNCPADSQFTGTIVCSTARIEPGFCR